MTLNPDTFLKGFVVLDVCVRKNKNWREVRWLTLLPVLYLCMAFIIFINAMNSCAHTSDGISGLQAPLANHHFTTITSLPKNEQETCAFISVRLH